MSQKIEKHFVTFMSPGTFLAEQTTKPIDSWDVVAAQKMAASIEERYSAIPYGFYFSTRGRGDDDLDSHELKRSPMYYLPHCKVETLAQIKMRGRTDERILVLNMESGGHKKIATTTKGWRWTQPLGEKDIVLMARG